jgi:aminoglycoside phosphotransferase family enzyme
MQPGLPSPRAVSTEDKVRFLASPDAHGEVRPDVVETHMSWLFAAGDRVLKLKKPVRTDFLDFSTVALRALNCGEEVRLNRRLAPDAYDGVLPLVARTDGTLAIGAQAGAEPVDWLVAMRRLPAARMLDVAIRAGTVSPADIDRLGDRLARFFREARRVPISGDDYRGRFEALQAVNRSVLALPRFASLDAVPVLDAADAARGRHAAALHDRGEGGHVREGHGDLRPEHIALDGIPVVIDCLEFNAQLREVDPFDELAFLGLECRLLGAPWIEPRLLAHVARLIDDAPPPAVMALYTVHRALLRARLTAAHLLDPHPRHPDHWLPQAARYLAEAKAALKASGLT